MELPDSCYDECFVKDNLSDLFKNEEVATNSVRGYQSFTEKINTSSCGNSVITTKNKEPITPSNFTTENNFSKETRNTALNNQTENFLIKFIEKFEEDKLRFIIDNIDEIYPYDKDNKEEIKENRILKKQLKTYLEKSQNGFIEVSYYQKNNIGRFYPLKGIGQSSIKRKIRHTISQKFARDIDIKNSSPSILYNIIQKDNKNENICCKYLKDYLENRDERLKELMNMKNMNRFDAKKLFISVINNKYIVKEELDTYPYFFQKFYWEQYHIRKNLISLYTDVYQQVVNEKEGKNEDDDTLDEKEEEENNDSTEMKNYGGSFMTRIIFDKENEILMNIKSVFQRRNINIYGLQFDGLFFDKNVNTDNLLEECHQEIMKKMNYEIYFDFKELDEIIQIKDEDLKNYQDEMKLNTFMGTNKSKLSIKETLDFINTDNTIHQYQTIVKALYNTFKDESIVFLYLKKWIRDNHKFNNDKELTDDINEVITNMTNKDKNINQESLVKISNKIKKEREKEEEKEKKINNKINKINEKEKIKNMINGDEYINNLTEEEQIIIEEIKMLRKDYTTALLIKEKADGRFVLALEKSDDELIKTLYCFNDFYDWKNEKKPLNRWYTGDTLLKIFMSEVLYKKYRKEYDKIKSKILNKNHQKSYDNYIEDLLDQTPKRKIVESCKDILWDEHVTFNTSPLLFGFTDGIYELDTGIFRDYTKDDYITKNCGWNWNNGESLEENEKKKETVFNIIKTIMPDEDNRKTYLDLLCAGLDGYAYQYMAMFHGIGKNSKSMMNDWIREDIGDYGCKLPNTCIFEQSSSGPNPALAKMDLMRFMHFSEPDPNRHADNGVFKEITGGGVMNNRKAFSNKCKVTLSGMLYCELNKYFKFKNLISHAEKRRIICLPFTSIFTDDKKLLDKGGIYKKENEEYSKRIFQKNHRKALFSILFEHYLDFYKRNRKFYLSKDCIDETNKYLNINITLRNWFFNNYEFDNEKFYNKEFENINGTKTHRKCLIYKKIGNNDTTDGLFNNFIQSETYKYLLSKEDKVEYSNHLNFMKNLLEIEEVKNNYHQDKWIQINGEKFHLYNIILSLKDKEIINNNKQIIGTFDNPEIWD